MLIPVIGVGGFTPVRAQTSINDASAQVGAHVLSNGQFVYGPNIGDFDLKVYLQDHAPYLADYADELYARSEYFSINPKVYLTLLEVHGGLISNPDLDRVQDPFGFDDAGFIPQIEKISETMFDAYYLHLYTYSPLPYSRRDLPFLVTPNDEVVNVEANTNAGTYAIIAALARIENKEKIIEILDNTHPDGFYQTYKKLFGNDDPLDENNDIRIPASSASTESQQASYPIGAGPVTPPDNLLQLPYLRGLSWKFGGVHDTGGCSGLGGPSLNNCQFTDASSLDFYPNGSAWGMDTSNMWVVAAASGIPTRYSDCGYKISHSGAVNVGWETTYYHLEGAKYLSGSVNQNDKIGVIANTLAEATCTGGAASGPHVHFSLKYNGAYVSINGTLLSGWYVHAGRWSYDTNPGYMWLERSEIKKYANSDYLLSEAPPPPMINNGWVGGVSITSDRNVVAVGRPHVGEEVASYGVFTGGSLTTYLPMLFNGSFGGSYNSAFYVQNVHDTNTANITIKYYDNGGALQCTKADTVAPLASKGYWVPSATCDTGSLPAGWVGSVMVTSNQPIVGVGRPHVGSQVTTYNGFTAGSLTSYLPMLFKAAFGGSYNSAFYVQNTEASAATVTIKYYDTTGALSCIRRDSIPALSTLGYWVPSVTCNP